MTRRLCCYAVLCLLLTATATADKRRSVSAGGPRCTFGVLDEFAFVSSIALDATDVYYVDDLDFSLYRLPRGGGVRTLLATFPGEIILDIAVDASNVYVGAIPEDFDNVAAPGTVYRVSKQGGSKSGIASGVVFPFSLVTDDTHVYWVSPGTIKFAEGEILPDGKIERVRKDGSAREVLAAGLSAPLTLAVDATNVYFSESGQAVGNTSAGIRRVPKSGGAVVAINNTHVASEMVLAGNEIVFGGGTLSGSSSGVYAIAKTGGAVRTIAEVLEVASGPRVIDGSVYYLTYEAVGDVFWRVPLAGGTPQMVAAPELTNDTDFEVDECGLYYGHANGSLVKTAR